MMFGLRIEVVVFNFMPSRLSRCCSPAKMNGQMGHGQVESAVLFLGRILGLAK